MAGEIWKAYKESDDDMTEESRVGLKPDPASIAYTKKIKEEGKKLIFKSYKDRKEIIEFETETFHAEDGYGARTLHQYLDHFAPDDWLLEKTGFTISELKDRIYPKVKSSKELDAILKAIGESLPYSKK